MKYYQLATTGGGSLLRGQAYGEFDHVVWLTMEADGPHIANLLLDGILPANVVTKESMTRFRRFLNSTRLEVAPILVDDSSGFHAGPIHLRLTNRFDEAVTVSGRLSGVALRALTLEPQSLHLSADPGKTAELVMQLEFKDKIAFSQLAGTSLTARMRSEKKHGLMTERTIPVLIDRMHHLPEVTDVPRVDGDLTEWNQLEYFTTDDSLVLDQAGSWQGSGDASIRFDVSHAESAIYFAARVYDERVTDHDHLVIHLDTRPLSDRVANVRLTDGTYRIRVIPPFGTHAVSAVIQDQKSQPILEKVIAAATTEQDGYTVELAIPASLVSRLQGEDWHSVQMTVIVVDSDEPGQAPSRVVWRGTANVDNQNLGYGYFVRVE